MAKTTISKVAGKLIDVYRESAYGWCADSVTNLRASEAGLLVDEEKQNYFEICLAAFFADCETTKAKSEETVDYIERAMKYGAEKVASLTEAMKKATPLYTYFSDVDKLFSLLCSECIGYYQQKKNETVFVFAKLSTIAKNSNNLQAEEIEELETACKLEREDGTFKYYKFEDVDEKGNVFYYYVSRNNIEAFEAFEAGNVEMRNQRTKVHTSAAEAPSIWKDAKGNIVTLKAENKFDYAKVVPVVSKFVSSAFEAERKEEKKKAKALAKLAKKVEKIEAKFNKLSEVYEKKIEAMKAAKNISAASVAKLQEMKAEAEKQISMWLENCESRKVAEALEAFVKFEKIYKAFCKQLSKFESAPEAASLPTPEAVSAPATKKAANRKKSA